MNKRDAYNCVDRHIHFQCKTKQDFDATYCRVWCMMTDNSQKNTMLSRIIVGRVEESTKQLNRVKRPNCSKSATAVGTHLYICKCKARLPVFNNPPVSYRHDMLAASGWWLNRNDTCGSSLLLVIGIRRRFESLILQHRVEVTKWLRDPPIERVYPSPSLPVLLVLVPYVLELCCEIQAGVAEYQPRSQPPYRGLLVRVSLDTRFRDWYLNQLPGLWQCNSKWKLSRPYWLLPVCQSRNIWFPHNQDNLQTLPQVLNIREDCQGDMGIYPPSLKSICYKWRWKVMRHVYSA